MDIDAALEATLRAAEPELGDNGFSERLMAALPRRRLSRRKAARWTLGAAAATGSLLTMLFGTPLEGALRSMAPDTGLPLLTLLIIAIVAVPTVWALYSE